MKEKVGKLVAVAGDIVSGVCLIMLIRYAVVHRIVTGSITGLGTAFAAGAAILLIGGAYSWVTTRPVTPQSED